MRTAVLWVKKGIYMYTIRQGEILLSFRLLTLPYLPTSPPNTFTFTFFRGYLIVLGEEKKERKEKEKKKKKIGWTADRGQPISVPKYKIRSDT